MDELLCVLWHLPDALRSLRAPTTTTPTTLAVWFRPLAVIHPSYSPSVCELIFTFISTVFTRFCLFMGTVRQVFALSTLIGAHSEQVPRVPVLLGSSFPFHFVLPFMQCFLCLGSTWCPATAPFDLIPPLPNDTSAGIAALLPDDVPLPLSHYPSPQPPTLFSLPLQ